MVMRRASCRVSNGSRVVQIHNSELMQCLLTACLIVTAQKAHCCCQKKHTLLEAHPIPPVLIAHFQCQPIRCVWVNLRVKVETHTSVVKYNPTINDKDCSLQSNSNNHVMFDSIYNNVYEMTFSVTESPTNLICLLRRNLLIFFDRTRDDRLRWEIHPTSDGKHSASVQESLSTTKNTGIKAQRQ